MSQSTGEFYRFGPFRFDMRDRMLWRGDDLIPLTPKALETLQILVESAGRLVTKEELMARLWPDTFVEDANLSHQIYKVRDALGEQADGTGYIETLSRRGYRFAAPVIEQGVAARDSVASIRTLAVLPFTRLSADLPNEVFEIGMADAVINKLTHLERLAVRPTSAVLKYRGTDDPIAAGLEQRVDAVLDGKVQQVGSDIRVTVQLLSVKERRSLWAKTFDERLGPLFAIQDAISSGVAQSLSSTMKDNAIEEEPPPSRRVNVSAYEAYLKGAYHAESFSPGGFARSIAFFEEALRLQPDYSLALAGLAFAYVEMAFSDMVQEEAVPKARDFARRALAAEDNSLEVQRAAGIVATYCDWNWEEGERRLRRAIELAPGSAAAFNWYGWLLALAGRFEDADTALAKAHFLDPLSLTTSTAIGLNFLWAGDNDRAIRVLQDVLEFAPAFGWASLGLALAQERLGRFDEAIANLEAIPAWSVREAALGYVYAKAGNQAAAERILAGGLQSGLIHPFQSAQVCAGLGHLDQAFAYLEIAYQQRSVWLSFLRVEPALDPLRHDSRFDSLTRRMTSSRGAFVED